MSLVLLEQVRFLLEIIEVKEEIEGVIRKRILFKRKKRKEGLENEKETPEEPRKDKIYLRILSFILVNKMILYTDGNIKSYIVTKNRNVIILEGKRDSFRCRQRDESDNHESFKFISYKKMLKEMNSNKSNNSRVYGPYTFNSQCKL